MMGNTGRENTSISVKIILIKMIINSYPSINYIVR